jgi:hypothetical protein
MGVGTGAGGITWGPGVGGGAGIIWDTVAGVGAGPGAVGLGVAPVGGAGGPFGVGLTLVPPGAGVGAGIGTGVRRRASWSISPPQPANNVPASSQMAGLIRLATRNNSVAMPRQWPECVDTGQIPRHCPR